MEKWNSLFSFSIVEYQDHKCLFSDFCFLLNIFLLTILFDKYSQPSKLADGTWDNLGIDPVTTDYMYIMKSSGNMEFADGVLQQFGNIDMNPSACVLNYGQVWVISIA